MSPHIWRTRGEVAETWPGRNYPLGATWGEESTNFAVWAPRATGVWVCLFTDAEDAGGRGETEISYPLTENSLGIWHGAVPEVSPGTRYGYRAEGPWDPKAGLRFNRNKLLVDPFARAIAGEFVDHPAVYDYDPEAPTEPSQLDSAPYLPKSVVVHDTFDWGDDVPQRRRWRDTVIYELHVKGMTALHPDVPEQLRGTYAGLASQPVLDHLRELGVSAVELLPVHQFVTEPAVSATGGVNYWGYNTLGYFAPHNAYSAAGDRGEQVHEFKAMVKAFHDAGIEVILDVVYNHTAEGGRLGPTLSLRGLDDSVYHRVPAEVVEGDEVDPDTYWDVTGCGNTVDVTNPAALRLILDSLRYWVTEMHIDGFRFDLMSALARNSDKQVDMGSPLLSAIAQDPVLRHVKLIAEPWDASMDGYQVGAFPPPFTEWNDQYRDTVRDYWRGHGDGVRTLATRLAGSSDLYADDGRSPYASVNFITAHDGFTVRDLVSYDHKHNEANREDNRDGTDNNRSWNCGVEGETDDPQVQAMRHRVAANLMATLCFSAGVPMLTMGDELGRTQGGNNNAYRQDNEISWVDWSSAAIWDDVLQVTRQALELRREHPALRQRHWFEGRPTIRGGPKDLAWIHPAGREMGPSDWHDDGLRVIGMFLSGDPLRSPGPRGEQQVDASFMMWVNAAAVDVVLTQPENKWVTQGEVVLSTDPAIPTGTPVEAGSQMTVAARSVVVMRALPATH